ncbi:hypothetical protein ACJMK2_011793 [Sinanodonta woodiana]|uniref:Secreted protein n=1 Tax=Sinanodonta woodiana TaxID=1069815 RepID=A0ABD3V663_SINWO
MFFKISMPHSVFMCILLSEKYIFCAPVGDMCQPPANLTVSYQKLNQENHTRFKKILPEKALADQCDSKKHGETCPEKVFGGNHVPVYAMSTCPWTYAVDHDHLRFPSTILMAKPRCTYCIGSNGDLECNPITKSIHVLRRGECTDGLYQYHEST